MNKSAKWLLTTFDVIAGSLHWKLGRITAVWQYVCGGQRRSKIQQTAWSQRDATVISFAAGSKYRNRYILLRDADMHSTYLLRQRVSPTVSPSQPVLYQND